MVASSDRVDIEFRVNESKTVAYELHAGPQVGLHAKTLGDEVRKIRGHVSERFGLCPLFGIDSLAGEHEIHRRTPVEHVGEVGDRLPLDLLGPLLPVLPVDP